MLRLYLSNLQAIVHLGINEARSCTLKLVKILLLTAINNEVKIIYNLTHVSGYSLHIGMQYIITLSKASYPRGCLSTSMVRQEERLFRRVRAAQLSRI